MAADGGPTPRQDARFGRDRAGMAKTGAGSPIKAHNDATRCGYSDGWRVPTRRELLSIVHHGAYNPAIDGDYFPSTVSDWYWSNDDYAPDPASAWGVNFNDGSAGANGKANSSHVRLVRSGQ